jgi:hypothetical protein
MRRGGGKAAGRKTVKLTIPIPAELATRLYGIALDQGCGKAELAVRLLDQGCRRYDADRRIRAGLAGPEAA